LKEEFEERYIPREGVEEKYPSLFIVHFHPGLL
jgi:hypothetical protein